MENLVAFDELYGFIHQYVRDFDIEPVPNAYVSILQAVLSYYLETLYRDGGETIISSAFNSFLEWLSLRPDENAFWAALKEYHRVKTLKSVKIEPEPVRPLPKKTRRVPRVRPIRRLRFRAVTFVK